MKKIMLNLMLWSLTSVAAVAQENKVFEYLSIATGTRIKLDEGENRIVIDDHSVLTAEKCAAESGYRCLITESGGFVLPRGQISEQSIWEYKGGEFKVLRKVRGRLLGQSYSGFLIQSRQGNDEYWYLFSPTNGLLAFGIQSKDVASSFVLEGKCGFAFAKKCTGSGK